MIHIGFIWIHRFWFWYFWLPGSDPRLGVLLDYKPSSVGGLSLGQNSAEFFGVLKSVIFTPIVLFWNGHTVPNTEYKSNTPLFKRL